MDELPGCPGSCVDYQNGCRCADYQNGLAKYDVLSARDPSLGISKNVRIFWMNYYSRRKGGAGRGFKAINVVPTLYQPFFLRCTNVFTTFLKRRYDVFPRRGTSLARRAKSEVLIFWIVLGKDAHAKDALSKFGRFTSRPVSAIPAPRPRCPRIPEKNVEIARKRKKTKLKRKTDEQNNEQNNKTIRRKSCRKQ